MNPTDPGLHCGLIDESSGCDVIGRIHHHVMSEKVYLCVGRGEHLRDHLEPGSAADSLQFSIRYQHLGSACIGIFLPIEYLAMEVGDPYPIAVEHCKEADSATYQRLRENSSNAATADQQYP